MNTKELTTEQYIEHEVQLRLHEKKFNNLELSIERLDNKLELSIARYQNVPYCRYQSCRVSPKYKGLII